MIDHKGSFYLGVLIFIIPFLGFPTKWKLALVIIAGLYLILSSIRVPTTKRILKSKPKKDYQVDEISIPLNTQTQIEKDPAPIVIETKVEPPIIKIVPQTKRVRRTSTKSESVKKLNIE